MKQLGLFIVLTLSLSSCLKHDVLKQDSTGNFREAAFYTSGDFENAFQVEIFDTNIVTTNSGGELFCRQEFSIRLANSYRQQLDEYWDGKIVIKIKEDKPFAVEQIFNGSNTSESFRVKGLSSVKCGNSVSFNVRFELITPTTSVIASTEKIESLTTP